MLRENACCFSFYLCIRGSDNGCFFHLTLPVCVSGEWLLFFVYLGRDYLQPFVQPKTADAGSNLTGKPQGADAGGVMERLGLEGLHLYCLAAVTVSFSLFWGVGLSFDRYFYKNRKHMVRGDF